VKADSAGAPAAPEHALTIFRGSLAACNECGLVLDAKSLAYELVDMGGDWALMTSPTIAALAREELAHYIAERQIKAEAPPLTRSFAGAAVGAIGFTAIQLLVAYCAGINLFGADWLSLGAVRADAGGGEWWRAVTALTLHLDQAHLLGNLLFGIGAGVLASRIFGPGVAWASILGAGATANFVEMLIAPLSHRSVGASTAVFAALGLLAGFAWRQRLTLRKRWLYRWAPLIAGISLLAWLGAGSAQVDVLGHLLGFSSGVALGWVYARTGVPLNRRIGTQLAAGAAAVALVCVAWVLALRHAA
jgi:membrane associated rhomboid family serine protease